MIKPFTVAKIQKYLDMENTIPLNIAGTKSQALVNPPLLMPFKAYTTGMR